MNEEPIAVPAAPATTRHEVQIRDRERRKLRFFSPSGKEIDPAEGLTFERDTENRALMTLKRPGLFVVSKEELLAAIKP